jgi:predicted aconitase
MGKVIGEKIEASKAIPYIQGVASATIENLKSFCASLATYGGAALFHMPGITPEASQFTPPDEAITITQADLQAAAASLNDATGSQVDFVSLGCPHLSIDEIARIAHLLEGGKVKVEFWITTARPIKRIADQLGYTRIIETAGARFAADTCCVVAPIQGRFSAMATDSAKACYYAYAKNRLKTVFLPFDEVVRLAMQ